MRARKALIATPVVLFALVLTGGAAGAAAGTTEAGTTTAGTTAVLEQRASAHVELDRAAESVAEVQRLLNLAVDPATFPPLVVDGVFGPVTRAKLRVFQQCADLPPTGQIDPETLEALRFWANSGAYVC
jgi:peptidoglycan hydrolase-like protein with peptidoglycan-binding domain